MLTSHTERNTGPWVGNATFPLENGCLTEGIMLRTFILRFTLKNSYSEEIKFDMIWTSAGFLSSYPPWVINGACWWPTSGDQDPPSPLQHSVPPGLNHAVRRQQMQCTQFTCQKPDVQERANCCDCALLFPASWAGAVFAPPVDITNIPRNGGLIQMHTGYSSLEHHHFRKCYS